MKNKKGFTLIELLAVIVVLAIILVIAGTSVIGYINSSKEKAKFIAAKEIASMAEAYFAVNTDKTFVSVKILVDEGYLESDVTNPVTGKNISNSNELSEQYIINSGIKDYENNEGEYITESISYLYGGSKLTADIKEKLKDAEGATIKENGEILFPKEVSLEDLDYTEIHKPDSCTDNKECGKNGTTMTASFKDGYTIFYFDIIKIEDIKYYSKIKFDYSMGKNHEKIDSKVIFGMENVNTKNDIAGQTVSIPYNGDDNTQKSAELKFDSNDKYFAIKIERGKTLTGGPDFGYTARVIIDEITLIP